MSDAEPARKDEGDAPAGPRNPWVSWLVWLVLVPVLYVLSVGPVIALVDKHYLPEAVGIIYEPLGQLPFPLLRPLLDYIDWWVR